MKLKWKKNWKRPAVVLAVMVLVGASVYLNWKYAGNVAETDKILGQATLVNENGEGVTVAEDAAAASENDYFATARLSRKQARDSAISMLQEAEMDENATEEVCNEASQTLQVLAGYTVAESQIENLVTAKATPTAWCSWERTRAAWWWTRGKTALRPLMLPRSRISSSTRHSTPPDRSKSWRRIKSWHDEQGGG